jgi:hypothetical protein
MYWRAKSSPTAYADHPQWHRTPAGVFQKKYGHQRAHQSVRRKATTATLHPDKADAPLPRHSAPTPPRRRSGEQAAICSLRECFRNIFVLENCARQAPQFEYRFAALFGN